MIVKKYGGTSVGSVEKIDALAKKNAKLWHGGEKKQLIVLSAMSGETNRLINLVRSINPKASSQTTDLAATSGEQVSVALFSAALEKYGIKPVPLLAFQLGIRTDDFYSEARIQKIDTDKILRAWDMGRIPVVAGFQGLNSEDNITSLGRGGTDTSAVALAAGLGAKECFIYTDVCGVYTSDPRVVKKSFLINRLDYESTLELSALGSQVLHSRSVELAAKHGVEIVVKHAHQDEGGTRIMTGGLESAVVSGVALDHDVIRCGVKLREPKFNSIFRTLSDLGINIDVIVYNDANSSIAFTTTKGSLEKTKAALKGDLIESVQTEDELAKVSIVGLGMQHQHGVAAQAFEICEKENIEIKMISTSEIKISLVVNKTNAKPLAEKLHQHFLEESCPQN